MSLPNPEQELELIASTAALYRPQQIYGKGGIAAQSVAFPARVRHWRLVRLDRRGRQSPRQLSRFRPRRALARTDAGDPQIY